MKTDKDNGSESLTLVPAGEYRADVAERLVSIGGKLTDEALVNQLRDVEKKQSGYVAAAIRLGLMLEAKWASICAANRAGNWFQPARMDTRVHSCPAKKQNASGVDTRVHTEKAGETESFPAWCSRVFGEGTDRNMRRYRWLGRRYLLAATETLHAQSSDLAKALQYDATVNAEALMFDNAGGDKGGLTLMHWIAGRSMRQLIIDLRAADAEAAKEEAAEVRKAVADAERDDANAKLADGEPEEDDPSKAQTWRQMNLPGFVKMAKQEVQIAYDGLEQASGVAPRAVLKKLWTDYRNTLLAKVKAAEAKLAILQDVE